MGGLRGKGHQSPSLSLRWPACALCLSDTDTPPQRCVCICVFNKDFVSRQTGSDLCLSESDINSQLSLPRGCCCVLHLESCLSVFLFVCFIVFTHASLQCECFHKQWQGVKCLFEHMLESLLRAIRLSAAIPSASVDTLGAVQLSPTHLVCLSQLF